MASEKGAPSLIENTEVIKEHSKRKVAYYYDSVIGNFYYGQGHVMKPNRIRMTDHLLLSYGLWKQMYVFRPVPATYEQLSKFHKEDYVRFLKAITPDNCKSFQKEMLMFNVGEDCPLFENLFEFCQISCGGSIAAARKLMMKQTDISINWMGGLHHAKKNEASGFCYANDIVLAILELLKMHQRVLYVDIDVHHGDGVEEAFYTTNRVMTVSFHKYGDFFPGTGNVTDRGVGQGRLYTVNVPFRAGIDDDVFQSIFVPVMTKVMDKFDPGVVVLQCGADSLAGDRLGAFNLTIKGHGACVSFFRKYNVPLLILGGGGYTPRNVARCWTYETALALGREIPDELPYNDYYEYYCPSYKLFWKKDDATNDNTETYLRRILNYVTDNLNLIEIAPSVQMHAPPESKYSFLDDTTISVDLADPEERLPTAVTDTMVEDPGEYYDGETESGEKNDHDAKVEKEASESTSVGSSSQ